MAQQDRGRRPGVRRDPPFQTVEDYAFAAGEPLADVDVYERRPVAELGWDVADKLFASPAQAVGRNSASVASSSW